jgi:hypothetical protein
MGCYLFFKSWYSFSSSFGVHKYVPLHDFHLQSCSQNTEARPPRHIQNASIASEEDWSRGNILGTVLCIHTFLYSLVFYRKVFLHLLFEEPLCTLATPWIPSFKTQQEKYPASVTSKAHPLDCFSKLLVVLNLSFNTEYHWNLGNFHYSQYPYSPHNPLTYIPEKGLDDFLFNFLNLTTPPPTPSSIFFTQTTRLPQNLTSSHSVLNTQPPRKSPTHPPQQETKPKTPQTSNFASRHWS